MLIRRVLSAPDKCVHGLYGVQMRFHGETMVRGGVGETCLAVGSVSVRSTRFHLFSFPNAQDHSSREKWRERRKSERERYRRRAEKSVPQLAKLNENKKK